MVNKKLVIKQVSMTNFRGYKSQKFDFMDGDGNVADFILLGGPNGYGKSSLIDAIEWCFTGNIRRLYEEYTNRKEDTLNMQKSLIRHSGNKVDVSVKIEGIYNGNDFKLERIFEKELNEEECFNPLSSKLKIWFVNKENTFENSMFNLFYDRHVCSYEKNIKIYAKSRDDIYEMFSSFFGGAKELEQMIDNLEGFTEGNGKKRKRNKGIIELLEDDIQKNEQAKSSLYKAEYEVAENEYKSFISAKKNDLDIPSIIKSYPPELIYDGEASPHNLFESEDNYVEINKIIDTQIGSLRKIMYLVKQHDAYINSKQYVKQLYIKSNVSDYKKYILNPYFENKEKIKKIQNKNKNDLQSELQKLLKISESITKVRNYSKNDANELITLSKLISKIKIEDINIFTEVLGKIDEINLFEEKLKIYDSSDPSIEALRALVDHVEGFEKLRVEEHKKCPLCSSEEMFSNIEVALTHIAKDFLGEIDLKREGIQKELKEIKSEVISIFNQYTKLLLSSINEEIEDCRNNISNLDEFAGFKKRCELYSLNFDLINDEIINKHYLELNIDSLGQDDLDRLEQQILKKLCDDNEIIRLTCDNNGIQISVELKEYIGSEIKDKLKKIELFTSDYEAINTDFGEVMKPLSSINEESIALKYKVLNELQVKLKNDKKLEDLMQNLNNSKKKYDENNVLLTKKQNEIKMLNNVLDMLKKKKTEWDKELVNQIRTPLQKIYLRINRHTNIDNINLLIEGNKNSKAKLEAIVEGQNISASNILSSGQLSVVALAIFLTIAMGQKDEKFKCYFMDDPIQTMDDLNILSFIDLLRTELLQSTEDRFADQLFFTTCNDNLEKLISHKMRTFGVSCKHIHFNGYGKYEELIM